MSYIKYLLLALSFVLLGVACKTQETISKKDIERFLYQKWDVLFIKTPQNTISGIDMGSPTYEFNTNNERIKAYTEPPRSEKIKFLLKGDSISYPDNPKLPAVHIEKITKDSLILRNDSVQVVWSLYIKQK